MDVVFSWIGVAFGTLFVVAVAVAWWEHLVRNSRAPVPVDSMPPRAVSVDVSLDSLAATALTAQTASDAAQRRATLDIAMDRMARPLDAEPGTWIETSPMVLHSLDETPTASSEPSQAPTRA